MKKRGLTKFRLIAKTHHGYRQTLKRELKRLGLKTKYTTQNGKIPKFQGIACLLSLKQALIDKIRQ